MSNVITQGMSILAQAKLDAKISLIHMSALKEENGIRSV